MKKIITVCSRGSFVSESFDEIWKNFSQRDKYDFETLSDDQISLITKHYMKEGLHPMKSPERLQVFMAEMNQRSATQIAKTGKRLTIVATVIAGVSVVVGIIQLIVALKCR